MNIGLDYNPPGCKIIARFALKRFRVLQLNWLNLGFSFRFPTLGRCKPWWFWRWRWWSRWWSRWSRWWIIFWYFIWLATITTVTIFSYQISISIFTFLLSILSHWIRRLSNSWSSIRMYIAWFPCNLSASCITWWQLYWSWFMWSTFRKFICFQMGNQPHTYFRDP